MAAQAQATALFLDFDGTLAPIVDDPNEARPLPWTAELLSRLASRFAAVALLSGRPADYLAIAALDVIGNTQAMTAIPPPTPYHRWLGWHAPAMRRAVIVGSSGLIVAVVLFWFLPWGLAAMAGWDVAALVFLTSVWPIIVRADSSHAVQLASREDETRGSATALLVAASVASLLGVGFAITLARGQSGPLQVLLIGAAALTVVLSWTVVNTVFTLRYADLHFGSNAGIAFGSSNGPDGPTYRDFAYVAFTIGMCYQVSDTTVRDRLIRRTVLSHALLSYLFGAAIIGGSVNLIAGLIH